jgi:16S rRNA (cytidine1402-2'-O)-methyltransferase
VGTLHLIATPIGNLGDLSFRAVELLGTMDALACEDTRMTRKIFERYAISSPRMIFSYHEHNEEMAGKRILGLLADGLSVGLCTDGGMPGISDPGYRIVCEAIAAGHEVNVVPGPSAALVGLIASGLPSSSFTFKGFPPRKSGQRKRFLEEDADRPHTLVLFESPHRTGAMLADALDVLGNRRAAVCIELTKKFEEVRRGYLSELAPAFATEKIRGEATVVIAGNHPKFIAEPDP